MTPKMLRPGMSLAVSTRTMPGCARRRPSRSPKRKPARWMRRADGPHPQRIRRDGIGAIGLGARDLRAAVEPRDARAHGLALRRRGLPVNLAARGILHRVDDLGIAGAAAEHAAQRIGDLAARGFGIALQQGCGGHQHARRADAALRGTAREEGLLQQPALGRMPCQPFDGDDAARLPPGRPGTRQAQAGLAVDQHGAGAAVAGVAADSWCPVAEIVAQHLAQPRHRACAAGRLRRSGRRRSRQANLRSRGTVQRFADRRERRLQPVGGGGAHVVDGRERPRDGVASTRWRMAFAGAGRCRSASSSGSRCATGEAAPTATAAREMRPSASRSTRAAAMRIEITR